MQVSVIMGVYNGEKYLAAAIQSILDQTLTDFELLIINDGSVDRSKEIIHSFTDPRIVYVENDGNKGLIFTLNRGLELARGKYIARMDADDIALPGRLAQQFHFMEAHPAIAVSGASIELFRDGQSLGKWRVPVSDKAIAMNLLFIPCFCHPTAMMRAEVFRMHPFRYSTDYLHAEDYELWIRLLRNGFKIGNLPQVLLRYRLHGENIGVTKKSAQLATTMKLQVSQFEYYLGRNLNEAEKRVFSEGFTPGNPSDDKRLINGLITAMVQRNRQTHDFPSHGLKPWLVDFFWKKYYETFTPAQLPLQAIFPFHAGSLLLLKRYTRDLLKKIIGRNRS